MKCKVIKMLEQLESLTKAWYIVLFFCLREQIFIYFLPRGPQSATATRIWWTSKKSIFLQTLTSQMLKFWYRKILFHFYARRQFTLRNGCEKVSQKEIDAIKEGRVRVKYCGLNKENCATNYPQHVFIPTNSQVADEEVILGEPWIKQNEQSLQIAETENTTGNVQKRFIHTPLNSFAYLIKKTKTSQRKGLHSRRILDGYR